MAEDGSTRARILEAALRLFGSRGYRTSTTRELAAEIGLTSAALYYHFPSKEACLEALVEPYLAALDEVLAHHPVPDEPNRATRRPLLADYLGVLVRSPELTRLIDRDPAIATHAAIGSRLEIAVADLLARLAGPDPTPMATLQATAALGALRRPVLRGDLDVSSMADELVQLALRVLDG